MPTGGAREQVALRTSSETPKPQVVRNSFGGAWRPGLCSVPGGGVQEARPPLGGLSERQALWMDVGPQLSRAVPGAEAASGCVPFLHGQ